MRGREGGWVGVVEVGAGGQPQYFLYMSYTRWRFRVGVGGMGGGGQPQDFLYFEVHELYKVAFSGFFHLSYTPYHTSTYDEMEMVFRC